MNGRSEEDLSLIWLMEEQFLFSLILEEDLNRFQSFEWDLALKFWVLIGMNEVSLRVELSNRNNR